MINRFTVRKDLAYIQRTNEKKVLTLIFFYFFFKIYSSFKSILGKKKIQAPVSAWFETGI